MSLSVSQAVATLGGLSRGRAADDPELIEARRAVEIAKLEAHVARVVADAPALTPAQRDRLASLLHGVNPPTSDRVLRRSSGAVAHLTDLEG